MEILKKVDKFGLPIKINLKGKQIQGTKMGGCCSIIIYVALLAQFVLLI